MVWLGEYEYNSGSKGSNNDKGKESLLVRFEVSVEKWLA